MTDSVILPSDIKNILLFDQNNTNSNYTKRTDNQIKSALGDLLGWTLLNGKLHMTFVFDFPTLFEFMFKVANTSQVLNHHSNMTSLLRLLILLP